MKKTIITLLLPFLFTKSFAQNKEAAEKLVDEGVAYHDKGDYEGAIAIYDKALKLDKDNLLAMTEKAFSLMSLEKYEEAITYCQKAIATYPGDKGLVTVYVTYGNASDALKKTDKSIEIYDEGIKQFPNYYQLYFNKGVSLSSVKKYDQALLCFQKAVTLNPKHASSHNAIGRLTDINNKRIPALLAYCRFLSLEPQSNRAKANLASLQTLMKANVQETGKKSITITVNAETLGDTTSNGKSKENNFSSIDMLLSMTTALDFNKKNKKASDLEQFIRKFETVCEALKETKSANSGFYWDHYAPYFIEMKDKNLVETFAYIAFASSEDEAVGKWLKGHKRETEQFFAWSKSFE